MKAVPNKEELKGILRILVFGGYEQNREFRTMWTGGFVPKKAKSIESTEAWKETYGPEPAVLQHTGRDRNELELRLCHYLQLDEPNQISTRSGDTRQEKVRKMKTMTSDDTMTEEEMMDLINHMKGELEKKKQKEKKQLEQILEGNEEDEH